MLDKLGSSNLDEQQSVIHPITCLLPDYSFVLLGDREFCSQHLATWLLEIGWVYCLRIKKSTYVHLDKQESVTLFRDYKSYEFNLELTQLNGSRFDAWFLLLTLVYSTIILKSICNSNSHHKYLARISEPQRQYHRASMFTIGKIALFSCFDWDFIPGLIARYIRLNRHKIDFYRNLNIYNPYHVRV